MTIREFDTTTKAFVPGGFVLPEGKQNVSWLDKDTLLVAPRMGAEARCTHRRGYPYVVKHAEARPEALAQAEEVFGGTPDDVSTSAYTLTEPDGKVVAAGSADRAGQTFFEPREPFTC